MTEDQKTVCAIALHSNGYSRPQVAKALGEQEARVQELVERGANALRDGYMGSMRNSIWAKGDPEVTYRGWDGKDKGWDGKRPGPSEDAKER